MPNIEWKKPSDWDSSQDNPGLEHGNDPYTSSSPETLKQGYEKQWPPLTHGLLGWWPLHTDKPVDLSGNGNHGTLNGGPTTGVAGRGGLQATSFDGANDYIGLGSAPPAQSEYAVSFWLKPEDGSSRQRIIDSVGDYVITFADSDNDIDIATYDDNSFGAFSDHSLALGEWHFVYVHYISGSEYAVSIDGQTVETTTTSDGSVDGGGAWAIAADADSTDSANFQGSLFDVRVYNRALSDAEIQTLYEWGSADLASPPNDGVARYPLDGDATDAWGSNDGTMNGGVSWSSDAIRGQSGSFDGTDDYIGIPDVLDGLSAATLSAWVKESGSQSLFRLIGGSNNNFRQYYDGGWVFQVNTTQLSCPDDISGNEWVHYTFVYDSTGLGNGDNLACYRNAMLTASTGGETNTIGSGTKTLAAKPANSDNFGGHIDDVRIYDYALTPEEVFELYQWGTRGINMNKHTVMQ